MRKKKFEELMTIYDFDPRDVKYRCVACKLNFSNREYRKHIWKKHRNVPITQRKEET